MNESEFKALFKYLTGNGPLRWQDRLFHEHFAGAGVDRVPRSIDLPTGLGKTMVMAIWLIARTVNAALPRRLVYVVDRRAVVDQATELAMMLRERADGSSDFKRQLGLEKRPLPISTLRGQHIDNKEWLEDPASPAIIVGTVDMIGSRLLFEGYGTSRKMRPYHAGLLGADTLVVVDEAHLVPPFEKLLATIADGNKEYGSRDPALQRIVPPFKLMSLSATGRTKSAKAFGLTAADLKDSVVKQRLNARKRLTIIPLGDDGLPEKLADEAWKLSNAGTAAARIIVFCDSRKDAEAAKRALEKLAAGPRVEVDTELFVGGRRMLEREEAATWLRTRGFLAGTKDAPSRATFVIATSAGEVGVDLDADHMVCDLVAWERMVQRLGRVNRRGDGDARIVVVAKPDPTLNKPAQGALSKPPDARTKKEAEALTAFETQLAKAKAFRKPFELLRIHEGGTIDVSPGAILQLKSQAESELVHCDRLLELCRGTPWADMIRIGFGYIPNLQWTLNAATTFAPLRPALSRALVDAWSMTSLKEHTGRPIVEPWLRGWIDDEPKTAIIWRTHLPIRLGDTARVKAAEIEAFFEAAPPHASELLETETNTVLKWLEARAISLLKKSAKSPVSEPATGERPPLGRWDVVAVVLDATSEFRKTLRLEEFAFYNSDKKEKKDEVKRLLFGATLVVDARFAGLGNDGLLDAKNDEQPRTIDDGSAWLPPIDHEEVIRFRVRPIEASESASGPDKQWRQRYRFLKEMSEDGEPIRWLIVEKWLHDAATEDERSEGKLQLLEVHQSWAEERARELGKCLGLAIDNPRYAKMLTIAARLHDEGKRSPRWQRAFKAPADGAYAKTPGPLNVALLDGYRHEFASLRVAAGDGELLKLPNELQELALHLIAAHHGFARPVIGIGGCDDAPPSALELRARDVALRFARLQRRWGPWGLAWWESLLRAVDQQASRDNDDADSTTMKEVS